MSIPSPIILITTLMILLWSTLDLSTLEMGQHNISMFPPLGAMLTIDLQGDCLIPEWKALFFMTYTFRNPSNRFVVLLKAIHDSSRFLTSYLALAT